MLLNGPFWLLFIQLISCYIVLEFSKERIINMKQLCVLIFAAAILFCFSSCSKEHDTC